MKITKRKQVPDRAYNAYWPRQFVWTIDSEAYLISNEYLRDDIINDDVGFDFFITAKEKKTEEDGTCTAKAMGFSYVDERALKDIDNPFTYYKKAHGCIEKRNQDNHFLGYIPTYSIFFLFNEYFPEEKYDRDSIAMIAHLYGQQGRFAYDKGSFESNIPYYDCVAYIYGEAPEDEYRKKNEFENIPEEFFYEGPFWKYVDGILTKK